MALTTSNRELCAPQENLSLGTEMGQGHAKKQAEWQEQAGTKQPQIETSDPIGAIRAVRAPHNMDYLPTRWP